MRQLASGATNGHHIAAVWEHIEFDDLVSETEQRNRISAKRGIEAKF